jgi:hypothetical protein
MGETAMVKYGDGQVKVRLEAMGKSSVIIKLVETGERMELELGGLAAKAPKTAPLVR